MGVPILVSAPTRLFVDNYVFIQQNAALSTHCSIMRHSLNNKFFAIYVKMCVSSLKQFITSKCILFKSIVKSQGRKIRNNENKAGDHKICYRFAYKKSFSLYLFDKPFKKICFQTQRELTSVNLIKALPWIFWHHLVNEKEKPKNISAAK